MSDGSIIIDVKLDKEQFERDVSSLKDVTKQATIALAAGSAAALGVAAAIYKTADAASQAGDRIDKTSARIGFSTTKFQEWDYILKQNGGSIESLEMGMRTLTDKIDLAKQGNEEAARAFSAVGISIDDLKTKSREDIFESLVRGLQGMTNETDKAAVGGELLSRAYIDLAPTLAQSAQSTEELRKRFYDLNLLIKDEVIKQGVEFGDRLDDLRQTTARLVVEIGAQFLPVLAKLASWLAEFIGNRERMEAIATAFKLAAVAVAALAAGAIAYGVSLLALNASLIATTAAQWLLNVAMSANPIALVIGLVAALGVALIALSGGLGDFVTGFLEAFASMFSAADDFFKALVDMLGNQFPTAASYAADALRRFREDFRVVFDYLAERINSLIAAMKDWARSFRDAIVSVGEYLKQIPSDIAGVMSQAWTAFVAGAANLVNAAKTEMAKFVNAIINAVASLPSQMYNYGLNIVKSLWDGLKAQFDALIAWAKSKYAELAAAVSGGSVAPSSYTTSAAPSSFSPAFAPAGAGSSVNITQIINSPEPLEPSDIRRELEDSMALWGES
jgi:hypothetical protein